MAFRANRFYGNVGTTSGYNDPSMAQAASNLGKLFSGIPDAGDAYKAEEAKATREKAARLAELFNYAKSSGYNRETADRLGIAAGSYNPNQSFYAVDQSNATSRANNAADNTRALQTNAADSARAIETNANTVKGSTIASLFAPLNPGQVRPEVPVGVAGLVGLPAIAPAVGSPKPESETEVKARILAGLPANDQRNAALGSVGVTAVETPEGARYVATPDAAGQTPLPPDMSSRVQNYGAPGGKQGTAVPDRTGRLRDTQTGEELPAGSRVFSAQASGTPAQLGGKTTEAENRDAYAAKMVDGATADILGAFDSGKLPTGMDGVLRWLSAAAPGVLSPALTNSMSPEGQRFYQNVRTALPMQLLTQSGQGVTEAEYERKMLELVPAAGEDPGVTAAKRRQFAIYADAVRGLAGGALAKVGLAPQQPGSSAAPNTTAPGDPAGAAGTQPQGAPTGAPAPAAQPVRVSTPEEARRLPRGTPIILPDGSTGRVP